MKLNYTLTNKCQASRVKPNNRSKPVKLYEICDYISKIEIGFCMPDFINFSP